MSLRSNPSAKSTSDQLLRQTLDMEKKLTALKNKMAVENEQRANLEAQKASTGSYWRSGNAKLGGVRNYARDVKVRQKNLEQELRSKPKKAKPKPSASSSSSSSSQKHSFMSKDVKKWEMSDTLSWLTSLNLTQYGAKFAENEIYGEILLELGLDDLDYMGIKVLGHRKKLLKGIEELKRNGKPSNNPPPVPSHVAEAKEPQEAPRKHWSEVKPLSENEVTAQHQVEEYDEEAEAAAFRAAVSDWRKNGSDVSKAAPGDKILVSRVSPAKPKFGFANIDSGDTSWKNPWAGDDDADGDAKQSGGGNEGGGGKFLQGDYDEEAEAAAFKRAVDEWRNPTTKSAASNNNSTEEGIVGTDLEGLAKSSNVAANLAKQMEADFEQKKKDLAKRRAEAEQAMKERLAAKEKELNELYANKENGEWSEEDLVGFGESKEGARDEDDVDDDNYRGGAKGGDEDRGREEHKAVAASPKLVSPSKDETVVEFLTTEVYSPDAKEETTGFVVEEDSDED